MTTVVLLILAVVWAVVLGPALLRKRAERHSGDSIGAFHRQLSVLGQAGPSLVDPANRMAVPGTNRSQSRGSRPPSGRHDPFFRPEACRRRRDVLLVLAGVTLVSGLLGVVPSLRPLLAITGLALVALFGYVAMIVRLRTLALEREVKLRYLPQVSQHEPTFVIRRVATR